MTSFQIGKRSYFGFKSKEETGLKLKRKSPERNKNVRAPENKAAVRASIEQFSARSESSFTIKRNYDLSGVVPNRPWKTYRLL